MLKLKADPAPSQPDAQSRLRQVYLASASSVAQITEDALQSRDLEAWYQRFNAELFDGHRRSWAIGRNLAGDMAIDDEADALVARAIVDSESEWSLRFLADLEDGRYDGADGQALARAQMYTQKYRGTANRAWVETGPEDAEYDWVMRGAEHCVDCPVLASMSPFRKSELAYLPGEGGTQCLTQCKCVVVRADGATGFEPF